jgi:hypothetical protein
MIDLIKSGKEGINATIEPDILVIKTSNTYNDYKSTEFLQNALKAVINSRMNHTKTTIFATDNNSFPNEVPYTRVDISGSIVAFIPSFPDLIKSIIASNSISLTNG